MTGRRAPWFATASAILAVVAVGVLMFTFRTEVWAYLNERIEGPPTLPDYARPASAEQLNRGPCYWRQPHAPCTEYTFGGTRDWDPDVRDNAIAKLQEHGWDVRSPSDCCMELRDIRAERPENRECIFYFATDVTDTRRSDVDEFAWIVRVKYHTDCLILYRPWGE